MDNSKYMKQNIKLQSTKTKTRTIGVNTEEIYPKFNCHMPQDIGQRVVFVPCLPYYYPTCTNSSCNNNCCGPSFNINPNILNQYQFVRNTNDGTKNFNKCDKCEKHSSINILHCCSSSNCTTCTNCSSTLCRNQQKVVEVNQKPSNIPIKKISKENGLRKSSQDKIEPCGNYCYQETLNENAKQYRDEELTRYGAELLENQNYKTNEEIKSINNDEKQLLNHLLAPTRKNFPNTITNTADDSDECLEDSENEDETSSIEDDILPKGTIQGETQKINQGAYQGDEEKRKISNTRINFNPFNKNPSKQSNGTGSDLEMLMMLKAFVNQSADKDVNPKLNQLINHLSSQDTSTRPDGRIPRN